MKPGEIHVYVPEGSCAVEQLQDELQRAKALHPEWPEDIIHQVAIMVEEAGEAMRAALNHVYQGESIEEVRKEVIQAGAMCLRVLENLPGAESRIADI